MILGDHIYWIDSSNSVFTKILKLNTSETGVGAEFIFARIYWDIFDLKATKTNDGKGFVHDFVLSILFINQSILQFDDRIDFR